MHIWEFYVYITTNFDNTVLYVGVTNCLDRRLIEHYLNRGKNKTFAGRYFCHHLVYFEMYKYVYDALAREKEIKGWRRSKKNALVTASNPEWRSLNEDIMKWPPSATDVSRAERQH